ncbi:MAG: SDR family oxidoreductase [Solirubrobacteraceae bacterium]
MTVAIVTGGSVHEHIPLSGTAPYTPAKHWLGGLTKVMALELGPHRIRVNAVALGQIATRMTEQEDKEPNEINVPLGRSSAPRATCSPARTSCNRDSYPPRRRPPP